jgi:hypothetical protein
MVIKMFLECGMPGEFPATPLYAIIGIKATLAAASLAGMALASTNY